MSGLFPDLPESISDQTKLECIERELGWRRRVYPRRVANQKMTQQQADQEIAVMQAIRQDYLKKVNA